MAYVLWICVTAPAGLPVLIVASYRDFHLTTKWTYADGISTSNLEDSDLPTEVCYVYSRDFISKRDAKGIWSVDTTSGNDVCEVPVDKLELPPPPAGFHTAQ